MRSLHLTLSGTGTTVQFRVPKSDPSQTAKPPMSSDKRWRTVAAESKAGGSATLTAEQDVTTRYVLVYLDLAAEGGDGLPRPGIYEVEVVKLIEGEAEGDSVTDATLLRAPRCRRSGCIHDPRHPAPGSPVDDRHPHYAESRRRGGRSARCLYVRVCKAGSYRGDAQVTTWLHRVVVNAVPRSAAHHEVDARTRPLPENLDRWSRLGTTLIKGSGGNRGATRRGGCGAGRLEP